MSGFSGQHLRHDRREVGGRGIEEDRIAQDLDPRRLERREIGRDRRLAEGVVLGADHRGLQVRLVLRQPFDTGDVVDRMHFAWRDEHLGLGRQVARQQRRDQHLLLFRDRRSARPGIAAKHHDELDAVFLDELHRTGAGFAWVVLVVIGDELDLVGFAADGDAAGAVDAVGPDVQTVESRLAPGRNRTGQRGEKADFDDLLLAKGDLRNRDAGHDRGRGRGREKLATVHRINRKFGHHLVLPTPTGGTTANGPPALRSLPGRKRLCGR